MHNHCKTHDLYNTHIDPDPDYDDEHHDDVHPTTAIFFATATTLSQQPRRESVGWAE